MRASTSAKLSSGRRSTGRSSTASTKHSTKQKPFFFGQLKLETDQYGRKHYIATEVKSAVDGYSDPIDLAWVRPFANAQDGEFIIGVNANSGPVVFFNNGKGYAVQLLMWSDFRESDNEQSLEQYLVQHKVGELSSKHFELIGNENVPGHIIITDGFIYVKGFFSQGGGVVKYFDVFKYNGDFTSEVAERNQATEMIYHGMKFTILVPPKRIAADRHSVMDCEGWIPLVERLEGEEPVPRDAPKGEDIETDSSVACQLTNVETKDLLISQVEEEMEEAGGVSDLKSDQNEEEELESCPVTIQEANDDVYDTASTSAGGAVDDVVASQTPLTKDENIGDEIGSARQMLNNEQHQTEPDNMPTDTTQGRNDDVDVESFAPIKKDVTDAPSQIGDRQQRENSCDDGWDGEMAFLSAFDGYVKACGFKYEPADLVRLHTSVKCSMCTLLAGSPGTGKSSLAELYMRAVADSPEKNDAERSWRQIFVNPAWMEPADLLGYETDSVFRHAPSHLAEFIRNISEGENLPIGIACFEEMNLACVEHYFSDFIQIMSRGYGVIPGCRENGRDLSVGCNFRVIGTCNSDETTRPLSPRFLSRCNTIELSSSFETTKSLVEDLAKGKTPEIKPFTNSIPITYEDFKRWYESSYARTIDNGIIKAILFLLKQPNEGDESIMSAAGFDMSGRIVSDLFAYIRNRPPYTGEISDNGEAIRLLEVDRQKVALDEFLAQRVFFACRPTPGTITDIKTLRDTVDNQILIKKNGKDVSIGFKLPLSASLLTRRIADYTKRVMQG